VAAADPSASGGVASPSPAPAPALAPRHTPAPVASPELFPSPSSTAAPASSVESVAMAPAKVMETLYNAANTFSSCSCGAGLSSTTATLGSGLRVRVRVRVRVRCRRCSCGAWHPSIQRWSFGRLRCMVAKGGWLLEREGHRTPLVIRTGVRHALLSSIIMALVILSEGGGSIGGPVPDEYSTSNESPSATPCEASDLSMSRTANLFAGCTNRA
jgi:hypothetical protein